jgi:signal transduction histidine kinase
VSPAPGRPDLRRRLRGGRERDWRVLDRLFALGLFVAMELNVALTADIHGSRVLNMLLYGAAALTLLVRREQPLVPIIAVTIAGSVGQAWLSGPPDFAMAIILLIAATYAAGAHAEQRTAFVGLVLGVIVVIVVSAIKHDPDVIFPVVFFVFIPWLVGRSLRHQGALSRELAEKADRAQAAREQDERMAVIGERARIARELHDVLAHNLSVMVVQAGAARRIVERDPDTAADAADLIRTTGREALAELRSLLGPMHREDGGEPLEGVPSLKQINRLVRRAREAGLTVKLRVEGDAAELPTGVDLTAYRVVQEALTNTLKHAGEARAEVKVHYEPWEVVVEVEDDGEGPPAGSEGLSHLGGGHGLVGMRERVMLYGGVLQAGRRRGGGFAVRASLPRAATLSKEPAA